MNGHDVMAVVVVVVVLSVSNYLGLLEFGRAQVLPSIRDAQRRVQLGRGAFFDRA